MYTTIETTDFAARQDAQRFVLAHIVGPIERMQGTDEALTLLKVEIQPGIAELTTQRMATALEPLCEIEAARLATQSPYLAAWENNQVALEKSIQTHHYFVVRVVLSWLPAQLNDATADDAPDHCSKAMNCSRLIVQEWQIINHVVSTLTTNKLWMRPGVWQGDLPAENMLALLELLVNQEETPIDMENGDSPPPSAMRSSPSPAMPSLPVLPSQGSPLPSPSQSMQKIPPRTELSQIENTTDNAAHAVVLRGTAREQQLNTTLNNVLNTIETKSTQPEPEPEKTGTGMSSVIVQASRPTLSPRTLKDVPTRQSSSSSASGGEEFPPNDVNTAPLDQQQSGAAPVFKKNALPMPPKSSLPDIDLDSAKQRKTHQPPAHTSRWYNTKRLSMPGEGTVSPSQKGGTLPIQRGKRQSVHMGDFYVPRAKAPNSTEPVDDARGAEKRLTAMEAVLKENRKQDLREAKRAEKKKKKIKLPLSKEKRRSQKSTSRHERTERTERAEQIKTETSPAKPASSTKSIVAPADIWSDHSVELMPIVRHASVFKGIQRLLENIDGAKDEIIPVSAIKDAITNTTLSREEKKQIKKIIVPHIPTAMRELFRDEKDGQRVIECLDALKSFL